MAVPKGLGYPMVFANGRPRIGLMVAALIVLAVFTLLLHMTVDRDCRVGGGWVARQWDEVLGL